jgi:hypothetical protein
VQSAALARLANDAVSVTGDDEVCFIGTDRPPHEIVVLYSGKTDAPAGIDRFMATETFRATAGTVVVVVDVDVVVVVVVVVVAAVWALASCDTARATTTPAPMAATRRALLRPARRSWACRGAYRRDVGVM